MVYAFGDWRWQDAEHHFQKAEERDSYSGAGHLWRALACLIPADRMQEASERTEPGAATGPGAVFGRREVLAKYFEGQYQWLAEQSAETHAMPEWMGWLRGCALAELGRMEESIAELVNLQPTSRVLSMLGYVYGQSGQADRSQQILRELKERRDRGEWVPNYDLAIAEIGMGNMAEALALMQEGLREREPWMAYLSVDPRLNKLRALPRFTVLTRRMALPDTDAAQSQGAVV